MEGSPRDALLLRCQEYGKKYRSIEDEGPDSRQGEAGEAGEEWQHRRQGGEACGYDRGTQARPMLCIRVHTTHPLIPVLCTWGDVSLHRPLRTRLLCSSGF